MGFKRLLAAIIAALFFVPAAASAAITLSPQGQLQLAQLASQLIAIFNQIAQAQAQGPAYTSSPAFQTQAVTWTGQLVQIQQQLTVLLQTSAQTPTYVPTQGAPNTQCPNFYRALREGMEGSDIAAMQLFLVRDPYAKYTGSVNGYFDYATTLAVQRYQAYYGVISYGSPDTTGYGMVGPGTRASMNVVCSRGSYIVTTPPITVPVTPPPYFPPLPPPPPPPTVQTNYSTGQLTITPGSQGSSGGPKSIAFSVNMLPNGSCTSAAFILAFGDGQQQALSSNASCGNQIQQIPHIYANTGVYTATLTSGGFSTQVQVTIQEANNTLTLSASTDQNTSFRGNITATYNPGVTCVNGSYTLDFGDNTTQSLTFNTGCSTQTQTIGHTYPQAGPYLISAADSAGRAVTTNFTAIAIQSAGTGDPFQVLFVHGDGANNATTILDASPKNHTLTTFAGAHIETAGAKIGTGSIRFNGASYLSTPAHADFNYGTGPFTIDLWFKAASFPNAGGQATLVAQAGSNAADTSLGGAGLLLFGAQVYFFGTINGVTYHPFYNNSPHSEALNVNEWYHVAVVRSGNAVTLYVNGVSVGGIAVSGTANAASGTLTFGRYGDFNGNYFNGWIDEVNIAKGIARWTTNFDPTTRLPI